MDVKKVLMNLWKIYLIIRCRDNDDMTMYNNDLYNWQYMKMIYITEGNNDGLGHIKIIEDINGKANRCGKIIIDEGNKGSSYKSQK